MIINKLLLSLSLFIFSLSFCQSEEWIYAGSSVSGTKFLYRNIDIDKSGNYKVWIQMQEKDKIVKGKKIKQGSSVELWQIDCEEKKYKILTYTDYDSKGKTLKSGNLYDDYSYTVPDSMADRIRSLICNQ